ncbi:MAG TPA: LysM domain-containing protein, partial [Anaerolineales bacterium]|nr:LysM domain-containing protein [Anaerolineales bacterium]
PDDLNYAEGTGFQMIYEAHIARGDRSFSVGASTDALVDYARAIELAELIETPDYRLLFALLRAGNAYSAHGDFQSATGRYLSAFYIEAVNNHFRRDFPDLAVELNAAELVIADRNLEEATALLGELTGALMDRIWKRHVVAQPRDNLILLCSRYGTTLEAITSANSLSIDSAISPGQELVIPEIKG